MGITTTCRQAMYNGGAIFRVLFGIYQFVILLVYWGFCGPAAKW